MGLDAHHEGSRMLAAKDSKRGAIRVKAVPRQKWGPVRKSKWSGRRGPRPRVPITPSSSLIGWVDGVWSLVPSARAQHRQA